LILSLLLVGWPASSMEKRLCPSACRCSLNEQGKQITLCETGGLVDLIPVAQITPNTQVLVITGSEHLPNNLSLGPIFKGLKKLEEIHLTWSGIPSLGEHSFWGMKNLNVLNVSHNSLTSIVDTNFRGANSLLYLDLSHNEIESVPSAVFRHIKYLRYLSLSSNTIPKLVPRIFFGLTRLREMDLSYNPLGDLQPELFSDVPVLEKFSCAGCGLMSISGTLLSMMPHLKKLNLQNNRLTQIPHKIALLGNLNSLFMDGNHISFVETSAISGSPLKNLHLSHNHIIRVESRAFENSSVSLLDLSYNRLSNIAQESFDQSIDQISDLRLSGNSLRIEDLLAILPKAKNLRRLSLGDIGLTLMPAGLMLHSYSLQYINVSANYLSILPYDLFTSSPNLVELDLSLNNFRGLSEDVLIAISNSKKLRKIGLKGNPWYCDQCHIAHLMRWLQNSPDQESNCDDARVWSCLTCVGPKAFAGVSPSLLPEGDLPRCNEDEFPDTANALLPGRSIVPSSFSNNPSEPTSPLTRKTTQSFPSLFGNKLSVVVVCVCSLLVVILCMIISGVIFYSRHSAYYYTNEKELENTSYFVTDTLKSPRWRNGIVNGKTGHSDGRSNGSNGNG
ncbi:Leucine-rich repeat, partial [Trinorchestia longiramus]